MLFYTRRCARKSAVQIIYSWQVTHNDIFYISSFFLSENKKLNIDIDYFLSLCIGTVLHVLYLDAIIAPFLSCNMEDIDNIERAVLRIALFELVKRKDIPYKVTINEAIELSKIFGRSGSYRFINGALHSVVHNNLNISNDVY